MVLTTCLRDLFPQKVVGQLVDERSGYLVGGMNAQHQTVYTVRTEKSGQDPRYFYGRVTEKHPFLTKGMEFPSIGDTVKMSLRRSSEDVIMESDAYSPYERRLVRPMVGMKVLSQGYYLIPPGLPLDREGVENLPKRHWRVYPKELLKEALLKR